MTKKNSFVWIYLEKFHVMVCRFWATVPGSLKNHLNTEELARIAVTSLTTGGGLFGFLQAVTLHAGTIFPAACDAALATSVMTMILEMHRRLGQGEDTTRSTRQPRHDS